MAAEVRVVEVEVKVGDGEGGEGGGGRGGGSGGVVGGGKRGTGDAVRVLKVSVFGGDGAVWDGWRKRMQRRIMRMYKNSSWSCIVLAAVARCHAKSFTSQRFNNV